MEAGCRATLSYQCWHASSACHLRFRPSRLLSMVVQMYRCPCRHDAFVMSPPAVCTFNAAYTCLFVRCFCPAATLIMPCNRFLSKGHTVGPAAALTQEEHQRIQKGQQLVLRLHALLLGMSMQLMLVAANVSKYMLALKGQFAHYQINLQCPDFPGGGNTVSVGASLLPRQQQHQVIPAPAIHSMS